MWKHKIPWIPKPLLKESNVGVILLSDLKYNSIVNKKTGIGLKMHKYTSFTSRSFIYVYVWVNAYLHVYIHVSICLYSCICLCNVLFIYVMGCIRQSIVLLKNGASKLNFHWQKSKLDFYLSLYIK